MIPESPDRLTAPRILVSAPSDSRHAHLAWPKLAVTSKGKLILAYSAAQFHGPHGGGCPAVSVSADEGITFSEPQILAKFGNGDTYTHCGNLAIGVTTDDVVILMAMAYRGDETNSIFGWSSVDGGQNWQEINVSTLAAGRTGSVYGRIFNIRDRGYAVCGHFRKGSFPHENGLWISFSQDALHWGPPERISNANLFEPAVVSTEEDIIGLVRNGDSAQHSSYALLRASRRRLNWTISESALSSSESTNRLPSPFLATDPDDPSQLIALMTERAVPGNTPGRITLWTSGSDGVDWKHHGPVVNFPHEPGDLETDFGYPWMVKQKSGKWMMAFYYGQQKGPNSIWGLDLAI